MAQNFEPDVYRQVKSMIEEVRGGAIAKLPGAIDTVKEQAEKAGLPVIIQNCNNCAEVGVPAFTKATEELLELFEDYCSQAKAFFDTFSIEY
jgi:hypothetical protein